MCKILSIHAEVKALPLMTIIIYTELYATGMMIFLITITT